MPHAAIPFRPHHRSAVPLPRSRRGGLVTRRFLAESRNISFPRRCGGSGERSEPIGAPMPHAALWVVQPSILAFVNEQCEVSMPHAALWVVQQDLEQNRLPHFACFNAARGYSLSPPPPLRGPPPPLAQGRLFVYGTPASLPDAQNQDCCKAPSQREGLRYFSFPRRCGGSGERSEPIGAPMPHAALWVVQLLRQHTHQGDP